MKKQINLAKKRFTITNDFNHLNLNLTELSFNILFLMITQVNTKEDSDLFEYSLEIKDLEKKFNKKRIVKSAIRRSIDELLNIRIALKIEKREIYGNLLSCFYLEENKITISMDNKIKNLFMNLGADAPYFSGDIDEFTLLTNAKSKQLYLLLRQNKNKNYLDNYTVSDIAKRFGLENKYKSFSDFNNWVLKKAVKQINEFTTLNVTPIIEKRIKDENRIKFHIKETKAVKKSKSSKPSNIDTLKNWASEEDSSVIEADIA